MQLIQTRAELEALVARLRREPLLAVDTEAASFHRYHDRVYLVQISSRSETAVVDPLAVGTLAPLAEPLGDPAVEIVFHDADYDLRLLDREYGFGATHLFDTRVAAQLLNEPGVGLAALLEKYFGVKLDKRFQRADWSARPLSPAMLEYAAADTRNLPGLRDILQERLREKGRLEWAEEEFGLLTRIRGAQADGVEPGWLRMKGAKALRGRELAVLRELWEWREATAQRADRATFRILNNEPMLAMAKQPPADRRGAPRDSRREHRPGRAPRAGDPGRGAARAGSARGGASPLRAAAPPAAGPAPGSAPRAAQGDPQSARRQVRPSARGALSQRDARDHSPDQSDDARGTGPEPGTPPLAAQGNRPRAAPGGEG